MVLTIRDTLMWYKRSEVRQAMLEGARKKEIGVRYGEGFGKRPDALEYEQEILNAVQRGATSFHASEELWSNPLAIETGMQKDRVNELRVGWDLVLDIDFTDFAATKLITKALCLELEKHGVTRYGLKFSGNKGFHIGVAWESFPDSFDGQSVMIQFPDVPRRIADYLVFQIDNPDNNFALSEQLTKILGSEEAKKHYRKVCASCGKDRVERKLEKHFLCARCNHLERMGADAPDYIECPQCKSVVKALVHESERDDSCTNCGSKETRDKFDLKIDTQLIASRHMYRLEYSLHEKSGLVSLPISPASLMLFEREHARPEVIKEFPLFWDHGAEREAYRLFVRALAFSIPDTDEKQERKEIIWDLDAAPEESFPPCIKIMLQGMKDGKKRSSFVLINFLQSVGWNKDMVEKRLEEWNAKNDEPLREVNLKGSLRYHAGKTALPPRCDNKAYYVDFGVCKPDALCARIKNPVQYVRLKLRQSGAQSPKKDKKNDEDDNSDRRAYVASIASDDAPNASFTGSSSSKQDS